MEEENKSLHSLTIVGDWEKQSNELKKKYSKLTDSDLKFEPGKENNLITNLEIRLNMDRDEVINLINNNQSSL